MLRRSSQFRYCPAVHEHLLAVPMVTPNPVPYAAELAAVALFPQIPPPLADVAASLLPAVLKIARVRVVLSADRSVPSVQGMRRLLSTVVRYEG